MRTALFLASFILLVSCQTNEKSIPIAEAPGMLEIFSENELEDLHQILQLFESELCGLLDEPATGLSACYAAFEKSVANAAPGSDYIPISYNNQHQTLGNLHAGSLATFWNNQMLVRAETPDKQIMALVYQPDGKIVKYMEMLGEEYILIQQYCQKFKAIKTITATMELDVLNSLSAYNYSDVRIRTFLALHFITLNDNYKRTGNLPITVTTPEVDN